MSEIRDELGPNSRPTRFDEKSAWVLIDGRWLPSTSGIRDALGPIPDEHFENDVFYPRVRIPVLSEYWLARIAEARRNRDTREEGGAGCTKS